MKLIVVTAVCTLLVQPAWAVVLEEAPGTMPITPVLPPHAAYPPEATANAVKQLDAERQQPNGRPTVRSGRPFASHENPDLSNAEAAGVQTKKVRPAPRAAKKIAKGKPAKSAKKKKK